MVRQILPNRGDLKRTVPREARTTQKGERSTVVHACVSLRYAMRGYTLP